MKLKDLTKREAIFLLELIHDTTMCTDHAQLKGLIEKLNFLVPFHSAGVMLGRAQGGSDPGPIVSENINYPSEYANEYIARGYERIDPIVKDNYGVYRVRYWADSFEQHGTPEDLVNLTGDFGLKDASEGRGYSCGVRNVQGSEKGLMFFYGLPRSARHETIITVVSPHLHEAMSRILGKTSSTFPTLTDREKAILQWLMQGKSAWDVSNIIGISERTVKFHIDNVMRKLEAVNRTHAVAIALRYRIIDLD